MCGEKVEGIMGKTQTQTTVWCVQEGGGRWDVEGVKEDKRWQEETTWEGEHTIKYTDGVL